MAKQGPETRLVNKMRKRGDSEYGDSLVVIKHHGSMFAKAGVSDLIGSCYGAFFACEVKAPESYGGSVEKALLEGPTLNQRIFVQRVLNAGGCAGFAATVEQFLEMLECCVQRDARFDCYGHNILGGPFPEVEAIKRFPETPH